MTHIAVSTMHIVIRVESVDGCDLLSRFWNFPYYRLTRAAGPNLIVGHTIVVNMSRLSRNADPRERRARWAGTPTSSVTKPLAAGCVDMHETWILSNLVGPTQIDRCLGTVGQAPAFCLPDRRFKGSCGLSAWALNAALQYGRKMRVPIVKRRFL
jgi:hypothetical protein